MATEGHGKNFSSVFVLSVFFRGFRGRPVCHYQIEKALSRLSQLSLLRNAFWLICDQ
jgi:hypothetical protein